LGGDKRIMF